MIPRILHHIYNMSGRERGLRPDYAAYQQSWRERHPQWQYRYWDHESARALIARAYAWFLPTYDSYPFSIQRCDAVRYFILHHEGGLYIDMDIENLRPVDDLLADNDLSLFKLIRGYSNAAMASVPGHSIWDRVLEELPRRAKRPRHGLFQLPLARAPYVARSTGPIFLSTCIKAGEFDRLPSTRIHPVYVFEPFSPMEIDGKPVLSRDVSRSHAVHHMSSHWISPAEAVAKTFFAPLAKAYWVWRGRAGAAAASPSVSAPPHLDL